MGEGGSKIRNNYRCHLWMVPKWRLNYSKDHGLRTHEGKILNSLRPKFKYQSQINIWDVDVRLSFL